MPHANSGSPVFDEESEEILGILIRGKRDFIRIKVFPYFVMNRYDEDGKSIYEDVWAKSSKEKLEENEDSSKFIAGEYVMRISQLQKALSSWDDQEGSME